MKPRVDLAAHRLLLEDLAAVLGAWLAVQFVRRLRLEREVRAGLKDLERL